MNTIRATPITESERNHALSKSVPDFVPQHGVTLEERTAPYRDWLNARRKLRVLPYHRISLTPADRTLRVADYSGANAHECINFGSQDYLGLARDGRLFAAAHKAIDELGVHSAGSPNVTGRTFASFEFERNLAAKLRHEDCVLFATGWAAGFSSIAGLVREPDTVVMDRLAHNCLIERARHATKNILRFAHNDLGSLTEAIQTARSRDSANGLFVVLESLYSMDSDSPDLAEALRIVHEYRGVMILDIAHDFGAMGRHGLGLLESAGNDDWPDVIMGSFSKTFATNGGFVASARYVADYLRWHSSPLVFSNAISPLQVALASAAYDLVFSDEGRLRRAELRSNVELLRGEMERWGLHVAGTPSPIVPVFVGSERVARVTSRYLEEAGLLANLVEYPAVPPGTARFRFQAMSTHERDSIIRAAEIMAAGKQKAEQELSE